MLPVEELLKELDDCMRDIQKDSEEMSEIYEQIEEKKRQMALEAAKARALKEKEDDDFFGPPSNKAMKLMGRTGDQQDSQEVVKIEGFMAKLTSTKFMKKMKERYFVLKKNTLICYKTAEKDEKLAEIFEINSRTKVFISSGQRNQSGCMFELETPSLCWSLMCERPEDANRWYKQLRAVIDAACTTEILNSTTKTLPPIQIRPMEHFLMNEVSPPPPMSPSSPVESRNTYSYYSQDSRFSLNSGQQQAMYPFSVPTAKPNNNADAVNAALSLLDQMDQEFY